MRLSATLINDLVTEIAGQETIPLVEFLRDKHHVSEFKVADTLGLSVNQVRNLLYRLDEYNLVSFIRKKDKKKGWYEYYWTLDLVKARALIIDRTREKMRSLRKVLREEKDTHFYYCTNKCLRVNAEEALELQFRCPECDEILQQEDNITRNEKINTSLKKLKADLKEATEAVEIKKEVEIKIRKPKKSSEPVKKKPKEKSRQKQKPRKPPRKKGKRQPRKKKRKLLPEKQKKPAKKKQKKQQKPKKKQAHPKARRRQKQPLQGKQEKQQPKPPPEKRGFLKSVRKRFFK